MGDHSPTYTKSNSLSWAQIYVALKSLALDIVCFEILCYWASYRRQALCYWPSPPRDWLPAPGPIFGPRWTNLWTNLDRSPRLITCCCCWENWLCVRNKIFALVCKLFTPSLKYFVRTALTSCDREAAAWKLIVPKMPPLALPLPTATMMHRVIRKHKISAEIICDGWNLLFKHSFAQNISSSQCHNLGFEIYQQTIKQI